jgi:histidinol dehydrogenase
MNSILINPPKAQWAALVQRPQIDSKNLEKTVQEIIVAVKQKGDEAVKDYSLKFHGLRPKDLWVTQEEIAKSSKMVGKDLIKAISVAKKNLEKFHQHQFEKEKKIETTSGVICWRKSLPIEKVGLYIPGGSAPLFSTLLMLAIPAIIAGCKDILVCTPSNSKGEMDPAVLYVARLLGIKHIYKSGGAQAIAAMAYGTQTVEKVNKIFGPGNQYVTCAKKLVNIDGVAIDMLAGPSELAVYADATSVPQFVAADLLSQAEHGPDSQVILVATSQAIIKNVVNEIHKQLPLLLRREIVEQSLSNRRFLVFDKDENAFDYLNEYAPEHLIIASDKAADNLAKLLTNAGSVFLGNFSPESAGDYASGTNHSLPTNGWAKTQGGVSVDSFVKKVTFQKLSSKGLKNIGEAVERMAAAEGLSAHKNAVSIRLKKIKNGKI